MSPMELDRLGFLVWFTVPKLEISHEDFENLAKLIDWPEDCIPAHPQARDAWEKACNIYTERGERVGLNQAKAQEAAAKSGGVPPVGKALIRSVSRKAPILRRQLLVEVAVPSSIKENSDGSISISNAKKQLDFKPAAALEFNTDTNEMKTTQIMNDWVDWSEVEPIIQRVEDDARRFFNHLDSAAVRYAIRKFFGPNSQHPA